MDCTTEGVEFAKAEASLANGACVEVGFHKAQASLGNGACVEVGNANDHSGCDRVHVRNSRFPGRVVDIPRGRWQQLTADAQASGQVRLSIWFPEEQYGDFADSFFRDEEIAFESGVLGNEPALVGNH